jgi:hypothetical protein
VEKNKPKTRPRPNAHPAAAFHGWDYMGYHGQNWSSMENPSKTLGSKVLILLRRGIAPLWPKKKKLLYRLNTARRRLRFVPILF